MELERASGRPGADIRLSSEITRSVRLKIKDLGLDPNDTTGPELYGVLQERLRLDDQRLRRALSIAEGSTSNEVLARVQAFLHSHKKTGSCFALKTTAARRLLKKKIPKHTMKLLGYRSLDSMLKHEPMPHIYAAALIAESPTWHKAFRGLYSSLQTNDFEQRPMAVLFPKASRWQEAAQAFVASAKHNILSFKELGAVVILPTAERVQGLAITSLLLSLHYLNDIRAYSSYAKLQQVKPNFGSIIEQTAIGEPKTSANLAGQPVSWKAIQRHYGLLHGTYHLEVFEPHVQPDDLQWHDSENILAELEPSLAFWKDTQYACMLHDGQPVSFNILDVALGYCNKLPFADRIVHFVREHIWHELMSRYMHQENLEAAVQKQLSHELVDDIALA